MQVDIAMAMGVSMHNSNLCLHIFTSQGQSLQLG